MLDQFLGSGSASGTPPAGAGRPSGSSGANPLSGVAGGALAGGLAGVLLGSKKGRKVAGTVATYGGMAVVGGLAWKAWRDWQAGRAAPPPGQGQAHGQATPQAPPMPPADSPFLPPPDRPDAIQDHSQTLLRAMITAAKADGHIDGDEYSRIFEQLNSMGLDADAKAFVMDELGRPMDIGAVTGSVTGPEMAAEVYAASLLAIDPDGPAERGYLAMLAAQLRLDPALVDHLHASVAESTA
nr:tellurite resistance TerB family protein [Roseospira visakhapatnamensis]